MGYVIYLVLFFGVSFTVANQDMHKNKFVEYNKHCPQKITCPKIKTCEEAYYYLQKCKIKKLDRDKDGIPCEKLCK